MARAPAGSERSKSLADALAIGNSWREDTTENILASFLRSGTLEAFQLRLKYGTVTFIALSRTMLESWFQCQCATANTARLQLQANFQVQMPLLASQSSIAGLLGSWFGW